jgi:hypothetical protein
VNRQVIATTDQEDHYGLNFGERLKKKISLMEKYGGPLSYIDPNYMWSMPERSDLDQSEYVNY